MKIVFNSMNCGLGNNGGTQTIVHSANLLSELGHDVEIIDTMKNCFTWHPLKVKHTIIKNNYPSCDIIIGTGIKTLETTANYKKAKKRFHWIRGWETWQLSEKDMVNLFKQYEDKIIYVTNGIAIQKKLEKFGIKSYIQYAGLDIDNTNILHVYNEKLDKQFVIGGLINFRHRTKNSEWIFQIFNYLKQKYNILLYTYGTSDINCNQNHYHFKSPSKKQKNKIYKKIDFWLSTSVNEGFHIPPAEFMLTSGVVVGVDSEFNGTRSYLFDNETGFLCDKNWKAIANKILKIKNDYDNLNIVANNSKNYICNIIGSRRYNMKKFIKIMENV